MDIISQLQEQVNTIAVITLNTFGTLQRDAPPVRLSPNYPEPPPPTSVAALPPPPPPTAAPANTGNNNTTNPAVEENQTINIAEQTKAMSVALVQAAKRFDALVAALPLSSEEEQLRRIAELQEENEAVGLELQEQLEAAEQELKQIQELYNQAADNCLNLKKPD